MLKPDDTPGTIASYQCPPGATVSCPIHALTADNDELATTELMTPWEQRTASEFDLTVFPGTTSYINANLPELAHWVEERVLARCSGEEPAS